jgi:hypothetical protein
LPKDLVWQGGMAVEVLDGGVGGDVLLRGRRLRGKRKLELVSVGFLRRKHHLELVVGGGG